MVFRLESLDSNGAKVCKSCGSRQELSDEYVVFTYKHRLRYSREQASQRLPKNSQKLKKLEYLLNIEVDPHRGAARRATGLTHVVEGGSQCTVPALQAVRHAALARQRQLIVPGERLEADCAFDSIGNVNHLAPDK